MGLFDAFPPEEFAFFLFIFGSLAIFTGTVNAYNEFWLVNASAQFLELPLNLIVLPLFGTGNALIAALLVIAFVYYAIKLVDIFGIGFLAAVIFGALAIILGA